MLHNFQVDMGTSIADNRKQTPVLELDNVSFTHAASGAGSSRRILKDVSLEIYPRTLLLVRGPSGVGKSTFLRLLCRFEEPDEGVISYRGRPIREIAPPEFRRRVCYVQQTPTLTAESVRDNLLLPFSFRANRDRTPPSDKTLRELLAEYLMNETGLDHPATDLSVGQKQRLCLIRAELSEPDVLLLDEPTSALDEDSAKIVMIRIERFNLEHESVVVMVTHSHEPARPDAMAVRMRDGRLEMDEK